MGQNGFIKSQILFLAWEIEIWEYFRQQTFFPSFKLSCFNSSAYWDTVFVFKNHLLSFFFCFIVGGEGWRGRDSF